MEHSDSYQPINCEIHDGYELACIRRAVHTLTWQEGENSQKETLRFLDLEYTGGQEFLIAENQSGEKLRIRLDRITTKLPY
jgi:Rho-binding antiterminator